MNKLLKVFIITAVSVSVLALAGCTGQSGTNQQADSDENKSISEESTTSESTPSEITIENITNDQLTEMTGFEVDFASYLSDEPSQITFLKEIEGEMQATSTVSVFSHSGNSEDSTALYIIEENGSIKNAKLDEFNGSISTEGFDFDYMFYSFSNMREKQPTEESLEYTNDSRDAFESELKKDYEGQPLYTLHEKLGIYVPVYKYEKANSDLKLNTYTIVSEVGYTASTDVNVVYDSEGTIKFLYLDDSYGPGKFDPLKTLAEQK